MLGGRNYPMGVFTPVYTITFTAIVILTPVNTMKFISNSILSWNQGYRPFDLD